MKTKASEMQLMNLQETGFASIMEHGSTKKALAYANSQIEFARRKTPAEDQAAYRSYVRGSGAGYEWGWVLR